MRRSQKRPPWSSGQICVNPRKSNVSGLGWPRSYRSWAAKRPNSISRVFSGATPGRTSQTAPQVRQELFSVAMVLEPDDEVIREAHDDHVPSRVPSSSTAGPQVQHVVQVHVRQQRRQRSALLVTPPRLRTIPVLDHPCVQPFRISRRILLSAIRCRRNFIQPFPVKVVEGLPALLRASMTSPGRSGCGRKGGCPPRRPLSC